MAETSEGVLWAPAAPQVERTHMTRFARQFLSMIGHATSIDYSELHRLSLDHCEEFWFRVWDYCGLPGRPGEIAFRPGRRMIDAEWFPKGSLNYADAALHTQKLERPEFAQSTAILSFSESGNLVRLTRRQLYDQVVALAGFLHSRGVAAGDRVVGLLPNIPEAVVAMLATAAIGAIWSSCSPEFGEDAVVDRFGQIEPKLLITSARTTYNHKPVEPLKKALQALPRLPSIKSIVVVGLANQPASQPPLVSWEEALSADGHADWLPYPFAQPLCIVYSSGTTGVPKCMVHGAGGTALQHAKEHQLHCDIQADERLFYYTSTGWMMWNWLVGALVSQAQIVLYDGSPFANGPGTLWDVADAAQVTHFGAGARYYAALEKSEYRPAEQRAWPHLRCLLSTGSPLLPNNFQWLYTALGDTFTLASISGGTDILSCFVLGNPNAPVRSGRIQCKGLGMDVQVWSEEAQRLIDKPGELICARPFPSMPVRFWNDPNHSKYWNAYFAKFPGVWCHGDWAEENQQGEYIIYGRSDATLNPGGVRIGTAEIYNQLEAFPEIEESIATGLRSEGDEQIVLFLKLAEGQSGGAQLADRVRAQLKQRCSPRHVPKFIDDVPDLPRTISGKLSEIAVRSAINGQQLGNAGALANPECLTFFENWKPTDAC